MGRNDQQDPKDTAKDQPQAGDSHAGDAVALTEGKVATREANAELEHSGGEGGPTTRSDQTDAGVPMLAGDPAEPIGPEDAFGPGPKRGAYAARETQPHTTVEVIPEDERGPAFKFVTPDGLDAKEGDEGAIRIPIERPRTRLVDQVARAAEQGDAPGKGGVPGSVPREDVAAGA